MRMAFPTTQGNESIFQSGKTYGETLSRNFMILYGQDIQANDALEPYWKQHIIDLS